MPTLPFFNHPLLTAELTALESLLQQEFSGASFIEKQAARLMLSGGKRLRPALTIASAHTGQYDREKALKVAAAVEALHAAALAHDDVIDGAQTRRGLPTLNAENGDHVAIYAGDYLLAKAMLLLSASGLPQAGLKGFAQAVRAMCAGEVAQWLGRYRMPGYREYLRRILGKTGMLFAAACGAGALSGGLPEKDAQRLGRFGLRLGAAFQMRDDLIDVQGTGSGKPVRRDLADGIVTLPVLVAAEDEKFAKRLARFLKLNTAADAEMLMEEARNQTVVNRTKGIINAELDKAAAMLDKLPESPGRAMLMEIVRTLY